MSALPHEKTPRLAGRGAINSNDATTSTIATLSLIRSEPVCVECSASALSPDVYYCRFHATDEAFLASEWTSVERMWAHMVTYAADADSVLELSDELLPDTDDYQERQERILALAVEMEVEAGDARKRGLMSRTGSLAPLLLDRSDLASLPEPKPLIEDTLDQRTTALLAGHFGSLKSFLALDWSACIATGKPWQGRKVTQGRVLYIAAEGAFGLHRRLSAWEYAWGRQIDSDQLIVLPKPVNMGRPEQVQELMQAVRVLSPALLVIDTVARCAVGFDENSSKDMGIFVDAMDRLKVAMNGGTVLGVHHTGKDRKTIRGSSALEDGVDTVYLSEGDAGLVKLERIKRKDGPTFDLHQLKLEVISHVDSGVISSSQGSETSGSAKVVLDTFLSHFSLTGATSAQLRDTVDGISKATFHRALNSLISQGLLTNTGTQQRPFYVSAMSNQSHPVSPSLTAVSTHGETVSSHPPSLGVRHETHSACDGAP